MITFSFHHVNVEDHANIFTFNVLKLGYSQKLRLKFKVVLLLIIGKNLNVNFVDILSHK